MARSEVVSGLSAAVGAGDLSHVEYLVRWLHDDDPADTPEGLSWGLAEAISLDRADIVHYLLAQGAQVYPVYFKSALRNDASNDILQTLLDHGVNVNAEVAGYRLVHFAVNSERKLKFLLEHGADPNHRDKMWNQTPLDTAAGHYSVDILRLLLDRGAKLELANPLRHAAGSSTERDRIPVMQYLVDECHVDVNAVSTVGGCQIKNWKGGDEDCTPLQSAVGRGRRDRIEFLLSRGADPYARSSEDENVFEYALRHHFHAGLNILEECLSAQRSPVWKRQ